MSGGPAAGDSSRPRALARVARNTAVRGLGEIVGKLATLALFTVLARAEGPLGVGALIFALAWCELATTPIEMGFDRYLLRRVAKDIADLDGYVSNVVALKLVRAVPVTACSWLLVWLLDYDGSTTAAIYLLTGSFLLDMLSHTVFATFNGVERGDLVGVVVAVQRIAAAALGVLALAAGYGVVAVAGAFAVGSFAAVALALRLLARRVRMPRLRLSRAISRDIGRVSLPFAGQELLSTGISRADVILISAFASQAVVGYYGAAYRLLESTLFISGALQGAFAAMYAYLGEHTRPTIATAFQRSITLSLTLLVPCAVVLAVLPEQILELLFGAGFGEATTALRLLAPTVVVLGIVLLCSTLISSRLDPRVLVSSYAAALGLNLVANIVLVQWLGATGAALAMLLTELLLATVMLPLCLRAVGPLPLAPTAAAPLVAGAAMALPMALLGSTLALALLAGVATYAVVFALVARRAAPDDLQFIVDAVARRLPASLTRLLPSRGGSRP